MRTAEARSIACLLLILCGAAAGCQEKKTKEALYAEREQQILNKMGKLRQRQEQIVTKLTELEERLAQVRAKRKFYGTRWDEPTPTAEPARAGDETGGR